MDDFYPLSEEDVKARYITPALEKSGWDVRTNVRMEFPITDGQILLNGNLVHREKPQKADYILFHPSHKPIAIVEAKSQKLSVSHGIQQAIVYARKMDIPFAYSSNGKGFTEHDFFTGSEREIPLEEFPSPEELLRRFKKCSNNGLGLSAEEENLINEPYYTNIEFNEPRYYQRVAIDRVLSAVAKGQDRQLLVMATGTGKTFTAFQIIYRLLKSKTKNRVLYLADRNFLVDQSLSQDFKPLERVCHKVNYSKDIQNKSNISSYQIHFSLYQQLFGADGKENYKELYQPNFFDFIVVDECHRGSADCDSQWRKVLDYFASATQLGMTATPKETTYISNIDYFGEPVFTYSLKQGITDGFLAPFKVVKTMLNISDGWRPMRGQKDMYGNEVEDRIYNNTDYDYNIILEDRTYQVAKTITSYLKKIGRMSKTIVFCANEDHADRMRGALVNLNSDMCKVNPDYIVRITGSDKYGKDKIEDFIDVTSDYPVIATTSKLLSTGVDCKLVKIIVLDQIINSMTEFKQIVGRGTRLREDYGKNHFSIMDFRGVTKLFADPDWDGDIEQDENFEPEKETTSTETVTETTEDDPSEEIETQKKFYLDKKGCKVEIIQMAVFVYDTDGKLLSNESIIDYTKKNILGNFATLNDFIREWKNSEKKEYIRELFLNVGINLEQLKATQNMEDVDDFDFICHIAYDKKPLTRKERADKVKKRDFISKYNEQAQKVIATLIDIYMNKGIYPLDNNPTQILDLDSFKKFGSKVQIVKLFGNKNDYLSAIKEIESELYEDYKKVG